MPTRYLKPGIRDSELIDKATPMAETMFYRLLVTVDDFGRYDARPAMIKSQCFPVKESMTPDKCLKVLQELADIGLILLYTVDGKPFLQIAKWDNKPRASESHFPTPVDGCIQTYADAKQVNTDVPLTVTETETQTPDGFALFWSAYPKKTAKPAALKAFKAQKINGELQNILDDIATKAASVDWQKNDGAFIPYPATYLNQRRWEDSKGSTNNIFAGVI